jgi:hypothetical protein
LAAVCRPQPTASAAAAAAEKKFGKTAANGGVKNLKLELDSGTVFIGKKIPSQNFLFEFDTNFQFYETPHILPREMGTTTSHIGGSGPSRAATPVGAPAPIHGYRNAQKQRPAAHHAPKIEQARKTLDKEC